MCQKNISKEEEKSHLTSLQENKWFPILWSRVQQLIDRVLSLNLKTPVNMPAAKLDLYKYHFPFHFNTKKITQTRSLESHTVLEQFKELKKGSMILQILINTYIFLTEHFQSQPELHPAKQTFELFQRLFLKTTETINHHE
ncbi:hypothetical protein M9H77_26371 [Catharanthus roseus]|uniref:Uncharacterized protein n=1 Tax=Catharanthus roseus TaxID=4058 RepID=A0ACC0ADQ6_CATRO|nr:hypothetical protein M9H77_26371 [Catharanthus roseus]